MADHSQSRSRRYHLFVLSLWEEGERLPDGSIQWRYSLEHPGTAERVGFTSWQELTSYLHAWVQQPPADPGDEHPNSISSR